MKKSLIAGIVIFLVMFAVTCEAGLSEDDNVEYTDVVYSEDGSKVILYLDGVGVPITPAQRAMSTRLSKMAYDYLDVIFWSGSVIARAQWELGQSAGISGVVRDVNYEYGGSGGTALLAVGRKEGKTLLGIGQIGEVDKYVGGTTLPAPIDAEIKSDSKYVVFYVESIKTGLTANESDPDGFTPASLSSFVPAGATWTDSTYTKLGSSYYPTYPLPETLNTTTTANYTFYGAAVTYSGAIVATNAIVEPRFPRYLDNGGYRSMTATIDLRSEVTVDSYATFSNVVPLIFTTKGSGIFSFYIEIPVKITAAGTGTNAGKLEPINWRIRTGLGSELYSLDDGISGGGCVLMTIGKMSLEDWLDIYWEWIQP